MVKNKSYFKEDGETNGHTHLKRTEYTKDFLQPDNY